MFQDAIDQKPDSPIAYDGLGRALTDLGRYDEAVAVLTRLLDLSPRSPAAFFYLGEAHRRKGDLESAVRVYRDGLSVTWRGGYSDLLIPLGDSLREMGRVEEALEVLGGMAARHPNMPEAHLALGRALKEAGRAEEARGAWERVLALARDTEEGSYFWDRNRELGAQAQELLSETGHEPPRAEQIAF